MSVLDRGFIFGDGIYEVMPIYGRKLFRFDEHMARLDRSLAKIGIANPHERATTGSALPPLVAAHPAETSWSNRGDPRRGGARPRDARPTSSRRSSSWQAR